MLQTLVGAAWTLVSRVFRLCKEPWPPNFDIFGRNYPRVSGLLRSVFRRPLRVVHNEGLNRSLAGSQFEPKLRLNRGEK